MADTTGTSAGFDPAAGEIRSRWGWFVALGIGLLLLGGVAFANLALATVASIFFIGAMMLTGGIIELVHAFRVRTWGRFFVWFASGLLYAVAGLFAFLDPVLASVVMTLLLAASLIVAGGLRIWVGLRSGPEAGRGWIVAAGVFTLLTGVVVAIGWPGNSLWVLGILLAVDLIFQGWAFIAFGLAVKRLGPLGTTERHGEAPV